VVEVARAAREGAGEAMSRGMIGYGNGDGYGSVDGSGYGNGDGYGSVDGSGNGNGDGYGSVDGSGNGNGSGYGNGNGYGSGDGSGYGNGYGNGSGSGDGSGYGNGNGNCYGDGDGDGYGYGDGNGSGYPEQETALLAGATAIAMFATREAMPLRDVDDLTMLALGKAAIDCDDAAWSKWHAQLVKAQAKRVAAEFIAASIDTYNEMIRRTK
jgi:hypothetical protein